MLGRVEVVNQYFDPRKYKRDDLARILMENRDTSDLAKRVAPYELNFDKYGNPNFPVRRETRIDLLEIAAYERMRSLAYEGQKYILWISPPSEEAGYVENRFVVAIVRRVGEEVEMECRGICAKYSEEECLELGNRIFSECSSYHELENSDDLRRTPIPVGVDEEKENWIDVLEKFIDLPSVWGAIRQGIDLDNLRKMNEVARTVEVQFRGILERGIKTQEESIMIGAMMEQFIERRFGISLMAGGGHGMSNSAALGRVSARSPFTELFDRSKVIGREGKKYCELCGTWYSGEKCPYCGKG